MSPNLFEYATKELSQDAFICWIMAWSDPDHRKADPALFEAGLSFVNQFLALHGEQPVKPTTVRVHRQLMRVDIVAEIGEKFVLLIEDKVHAGIHGDQLVRYRRELERKFVGRRILPVFIKTGDQSSYKEAEEAGYALFLRRHILDLLRPWHGKISNAIFKDFLESMEAREKQVESYLKRPVSEWTEGWEPWIGFYKRLQDELSDGVEWDYVPNAAGGFLGAWWHFTSWTDPSSQIEHGVYLQIEQGPLCFKIAVNEEETAIGGVRDRWHEHIMSGAPKVGLNVSRPARMGSGKWMTVGRIELNDWMAVCEDGTLDILLTLQTLRSAASLIEQAAVAHHVP